MSAPIRPEVAVQMKAIGKGLGMSLPEGFGFALLVFDFAPARFISYISNAQRADMLKAMKEFIANAEKDLDS